MCCETHYKYDIENEYNLMDVKNVCYYGDKSGVERG